MAHNRDLGELFDAQFAAIRAIDPRALYDDVDVKAGYIRDMTLAAIVELTEALNEHGWKPWSSRRGVDKEKFAGELADVMCFIMNLAIASSVTAEELYDATAAKQKVNLERRRIGYAG